MLCSGLIITAGLLKLRSLEQRQSIRKGLDVYTSILAREDLEAAGAACSHELSYKA